MRKLDNKAEFYLDFVENIAHKLHFFFLLKNQFQHCFFKTQKEKYHIFFLCNFPGKKTFPEKQTQTQRNTRARERERGKAKQSERKYIIFDKMEIKLYISQL